METDVPYRFLEERKTTIINGVVNEGGSAWEYTRELSVANDFTPLGRELERRGLVRVGKIGNSSQRLFRAGDVYRVGIEKMAEDPLFLLSQETKGNWR